MGLSVSVRFSIITNPDWENKTFCKTIAVKSFVESSSMAFSQSTATYVSTNL